MLGRAVNNYQPPPSQQRNAEVAAKVAALKPTSRPSSQEPQKGIDDMMKEAPSKSKGSISGWTSSGSINKPAPRPFARTPSSSGYQALPGTYAAPRQTTEMKRPYEPVEDKDAIAARIKASRDEALRRVRSWNASAPTAVSSFNNTTPAAKAGASSHVAINLEDDIVDLTQDEAPKKSHVPTSFVELNWDPEDFENDSEIDLDMEYALPLPKAALTAQAQPLQPVSVNKNVPPATPPSNGMLPPKPMKTTSHGLPIPSSAPSWAESSPSHMQPASSRMDAIKETPNAPPMSSEASIDAEPRPAKRRRIPTWEQAQSQKRRCEKCGSEAHQIMDCPEHPKNRRISAAAPASTDAVKQIREHAFSPLPGGGDTSLPWNQSAESMKLKEQQKKDKAKRDKKAADEFWQAGKAEAMKKEKAKATKKAEKSSNIPPKEIFLSDEQQKVLLLVTKDKKSVFFTGSAGTGKSVLMRAIISDLQKTHKKTPENIAVTASTGLAACNIGGVTLHSFSGVGLGKEAVPDLVKKIMRNQKAKKRWLTCKVLIIDEISMVDGDFFDKLEGIARIVRKNSRPFGGIQLVVTGDFFQLPPVPDYGNRNVKFAFDADTWQTSIHHTIGLTEVFRQRDPGEPSHSHPPFQMFTNFTQSLQTCSMRCVSVNCPTKP